MDVVWKPIEGFEEYEVSNVGAIRRNGTVKSLRSDRKGYLSVVLWHKQRSFKRQVSRLVAAAFIGQRPDGFVVAHINGINTDNRVENLRYSTPHENEADKVSHGTQLRGERHHQAKLTAAQVAQIRQRFSRYSRTNGAAALAVEFGVSDTAIYLIVSGKNWRNT